MNITPAPYCKLCHFYHGANGVVCGLHPDGPDSETCRDYTPNASDRIQGQISRDAWNIRSSHDYKAWQKNPDVGFACGIFQLRLPARMARRYPFHSTNEQDEYASEAALLTRKAYKSDLTDPQWQLLEPLIPPAKTGGRHRSLDMREVVNAIFVGPAHRMSLGDATV